MEELYLIGFGCIVFSAFLTFRLVVEGFESYDVDYFYQVINRGSIIAGIGLLAFIMHAIHNQNYFSFALHVTAFFLNIYFYWERNRE